MTYKDSQEQIQSLKDWKARVANDKTIESNLQDLLQLNYYGDSLIDMYSAQLEAGKLQPYSLNLLGLYFDVVITVNDQIQDAGNTPSENILKALSLESLKKINDMFFHPTVFRRLMNDQFATLPQLSKRWNSLLDNSFDKKKVKKLERKLSDYSSNPELNKIWQNSLAYKMIKSGKGLSDLADRELKWRKISDSINNAFGSVATGASSAFGTVAGSIAWREGYLKNNQKLLTKLKSELLPFDLLMEKKAYKFTDLTIPGHWGHVGVYLGTKDQLIELGLWNHPSIVPFKKGIEEGKSIFQVRRWGLVFDSLDEFVNLDEMAVLRVEDYTKQRTEILTQTLEYLGDQLHKSYDFSFDAMTGETVTCTEIIAFSFGPIAWPMEELLGRLTISPNDLAKVAFYKNSPVKMVLYATGDKSGLHIREEEEFAKTINFYKRNGDFKEHSVKCKRTRYRHRRNELRFKYSCEDLFMTKDYASTGQY